MRGSPSGGGVGRLINLLNSQRKIIQNMPPTTPSNPPQTLSAFGPPPPPWPLQKYSGSAYEMFSEKEISWKQPYYIITFFWRNPQNHISFQITSIPGADRHSFYVILKYESCLL